MFPQKRQELMEFNGLVTFKSYGIIFYQVKKKGVDGIETMLPADEFVEELRKRDFLINESFIYI